MLKGYVLNLTLRHGKHIVYVQHWFITNPRSSLGLAWYVT